LLSKESVAYQQRQQEQLGRQVDIALGHDQRVSGHDPEGKHGSC
jgi:hypothetical protein